MVFPERGGSFPQRGVFDAPNIYPTAHTTHIMTKELMLEWVSQVFSEAVEDGQKVKKIIENKKN